MGKVKKIGLGIAIGFAALIVLGAIGSYVSEDTVKSNYIQKEETSKSIPLGDKKNPAPIGENIIAGDISFKVIGVKDISSVGSEYLGEDADGVFLVIDLIMENNGKESVQIISDYFKLIDSQERKFESDNQAWIYLDENVFLKQLQPTIPTKGQIIFDIPTNSETYTLEVTDSIFGLDKKYINIGVFP